MKLLNPNSFHPASLWFFGLGLAAAASLSRNLGFLTCLIALCVVLLALSPKELGAAVSLRVYLLLAAAVVLSRIVFRIIFNTTYSANDTILDLPKLSIQFWFGQELQILGAVSAQALVSAMVEGLRLAAIILGIAVAASLANPRKLLKSTPAALYEIGTAVSMAINLAPQIIKSLNRVRAAKKLRGRSNGIGAMASIVIPVLEDAIESTIALSVSMESRGFGSSINSSARLLSGLLSISSALAAGIGAYLVITSGAQNYAWLLIALLLAIASLAITNSSNSKTRLVRNKFSALDLIPAVLSVVAPVLSLSLGAAL